MVVSVYLVFVLAVTMLILYLSVLLDDINENVLYVVLRNVILLSG